MVRLLHTAIVITLDAVVFLKSLDLGKKRVRADVRDEEYLVGDLRVHAEAFVVGEPLKDRREDNVHCQLLLPLHSVDLVPEFEVLGPIVCEHADQGPPRRLRDGAQQPLHQPLFGVSATVKGLERERDDVLLELDDVLRRRHYLDVLPEVWSQVIESDEQVTGDVGVRVLDPVDHCLREVEDGVLVRLHRLGGVYHEGERRVDDRVGRDGGHGAVLAVAVDALDGAAAAVAVVEAAAAGGIGAALALHAEAVVGAVGIPVAVASRRERAALAVVAEKTVGAV